MGKIPKYLKNIIAEIDAILEESSTRLKNLHGPDGFKEQTTIQYEMGGVLKCRDIIRKHTTL